MVIWHSNMRYNPYRDCLHLHTMSFLYSMLGTQFSGSRLKVHERMQDFHPPSSWYQGTVYVYYMFQPAEKPSTSTLFSVIRVYVLVG